jgi:hypothetical protein
MVFVALDLATDFRGHTSANGVACAASRANFVMDAVQADVTRKTDCTINVN